MTLTTALHTALAALTPAIPQLALTWRRIRTTGFSTGVTTGRRAVLAQAASRILKQESVVVRIRTAPLLLAVTAALSLNQNGWCLEDVRFSTLCAYVPVQATVYLR